MLKRFTVAAFAGVIALGIQAPPSRAVVQEAQSSAAIHLVDGQLYLNGKLIHKGFSISQTQMAFVYFYIPEHGLFTVSNHQFEGATEGGNFNGRELSMSVNGLDVTIKSATRILTGDSAPAWIKFDPNFKLEVKSVMLGYGDKEKAPYDWPDQLRKARH